MARTKSNQRPAKRVEVPMGATGGRTPPSKITIAVLGVSIIAAIWAVAMLTKAGKYGYVYFYAYSEFYMGVITLVALSITSTNGWQKRLKRNWKRLQFPKVTILYGDPIRWYDYLASATYASSSPRVYAMVMARPPST